MRRRLPSPISLPRHVSRFVSRRVSAAGCKCAFSRRLLSDTRVRRDTREDPVDIHLAAGLDHGRAVDRSASEAILDPTLPPPSNPDHHDLPSFLAHARRSGVSTSSTVYRGTLYEYLTARSLQRYGFELVRVGRAGDQGIDLVGLWKIPAYTGKDTKDDGSEPTAGAVQTHTLRVLVQCKRISRTSKARPNLIRELEGAVRGPNVPVGWRGPGVMGILVAERGATKGVRDAMAGTRRAMGWIMLEGGDDEPQENGDEVTVESDVLLERGNMGRVHQMLWNKAASNLGLEGLEVVTRYVAGPEKESDGGEALNQEAVLMWQGKTYPGSDSLKD